MATISIRIDDELKSQMEDTASAIGLTTTAVYNVFSRQFVAHGGFPFDVVKPVPTEAEFAAEMERRYAEVKAGLGAVHELVEA